METIRDEFMRLFSNAPGHAGTIGGTIIALAIAAVLGSYLALIYEWTYTGTRHKRFQFSYTMVLLTVGGAFVWLIVADNIARAFGLAGALALIRYRTKMQDPKDTTLVFFAMIVGMACGLHQYFNAIYGAFFVGLLLWLIQLANKRVAKKPGAADAKAAPQDDPADDSGPETEEATPDQDSGSSQDPPATDSPPDSG